MEITHKDQILNLKDGECYVWPESDYGKAEIYQRNGSYILFGIPMFGGIPYFVAVFPISEIDSLIKTVEKWT